MKKEIYVSVDVEASGPIPGEYSMLSIGACVVGDISKTFYVELKPINDNFVKRALEVSQFSMEELKSSGVEPKTAMENFEKWIKKVCLSVRGENREDLGWGDSRAVFVGFNATFDWSFVNYYFHKFIERNPFGISGLDIKAYYMGMKRCSWGETTKRALDAKFRSTRPHTHNALDDAIEQAEIFEKMYMES